MFRTIILDCQTKAANPNCEDCIARKTCKVHRETEHKAIVELRL